MKPRRKVVKSSRTGPGFTDNYFRCELTCGHSEIAYGRRVQGRTEAPKTVSCYSCPSKERKACPSSPN